MCFSYHSLIFFSFFWFQVSKKKADNPWNSHFTEPFLVFFFFFFIFILSRLNKNVITHSINKSKKEKWLGSWSWKEIRSVEEEEKVKEKEFKVKEESYSSRIMTAHIIQVINLLFTYFWGEGGINRPDIDLNYFQSISTCINNLNVWLWLVLANGIKENRILFIFYLESLQKTFFLSNQLTTNKINIGYRMKRMSWVEMVSEEERSTMCRCLM